MKKITLLLTFALGTTFHLFSMNESPSAKSTVSTQPTAITAEQVSTYILDNCMPLINSPKIQQAIVKIHQFSEELKNLKENPIKTYEITEKILVLFAQQPFLMLLMPEELQICEDIKTEYNLMVTELKNKTNNRNFVSEHGPLILEYAQKLSQLISNHGQQIINVLRVAKEVIEIQLKDSRYMKECAKTKEGRSFICKLSTASGIIGATIAIMIAWHNYK